MESVNDEGWYHTDYEDKVCKVAEYSIDIRWDSLVFVYVNTGAKRRQKFYLVNEPHFDHFIVQRLIRCSVRISILIDHSSYCKDQKIDCSWYEYFCVLVPYKL